MPVHVTARWLSRTCLIGFLLIAAVASNVMAQPGPPWVVFNPDSSVVVNYTPVTPVPPGGAFLAATYNGGPIPGSPFFIGQATAVASPPLAPGNYTVQVIYADGSVSPVFNFGLGFPSAPTIRVASADLDTAVLFWDPPAVGPISYYQVEATVLRTGQVVLIPVGRDPGATFRHVPPGLFRVRVRAVNQFGVGPFSAPSPDIVVGTVSGGGDLQVSLTWNTTVDMDLHLVEPDNTHVYWGRPIGRLGTARFRRRQRLRAGEHRRTPAGSGFPATTGSTRCTTARTSRRRPRSPSPWGPTAATRAHPSSRAAHATSRSRHGGAGGHDQRADR